MDSADADWPIRAAAFAALADLVRVHGGVLPWAVIEAGFTLAGNRFRFANQSKGIFRPSGMRDAALSLKTTVPRSGLPRYQDIATDDAFAYALQDRGPDYHDNRMLLRAVALRAPLIYFYGVEPGYYRPLWPTYASPAPTSDRVLLTTSTADAILPPGEHFADAAMQLVVRKYATVEAKKRLHQDMFRASVLRAYAVRCAVCHLPRRELLDAAHIVPDGDSRGEPVIPNGLALCKLHHSAYDSLLIGIRPNLVVEVSPKLLNERDGPVLEQGLKSFAGRTLHLPGAVKDHPDPERLEHRYELFRRAS